MLSHYCVKESAARHDLNFKNVMTRNLTGAIDHSQRNANWFRFKISLFLVGYNNVT